MTVLLTQHKDSTELILLLRLGHLSPKFWRKIEITVELRFVLGCGSQTSGSYKCLGVFVY